MSDITLAPAEDWDAASAEALMQAYEGNLPQVYYADPPPVLPIKGRRASAPATTPRRGVSSGATQTHDDAAQAPTSPAIQLVDLAHDRSWLEGRFKDLAARLDDTMRRLDASDQITPLASRLDGIEGHLKSALDDVARKSHFTALEAQITEVYKQAKAARQRIDRLDGIETKLTALATSVEAARSATPSVDGSKPDLDVKAIVSDAINRTVERFAASQTRTASPESVGELRSLITNHVEDYRREQNQTSIALATMQEALVRLIDRIDQYDEDALDDASFAVAPGAVEPATTRAPTEQFIEVPDGRGTRPGRRAADLGGATDDAPPAPATLPAASAPPAVPVAAKSPAAAEPSQPAARNARRMQPTPGSDLVSDAVAAAEAMAAERARVAAERASLAAARSTARDVQPKQPDAEPTVSAAPEVSGDKKGRASRKSDTAQPSNARKGMMIAGVATLVIATSAAAHLFIADRLSAPKMEDRVLPSPAGPTSLPRPQAMDANPSTLPSSASTPRPSSMAAPVPAPTEAPRPVSAPQIPNGSRGPQPAANQLPDGFKPKTVPESIDDDLQSNARPAPGMPRPSQAAITGIALDHGAMSNPAELARRLAAPGTSAPTSTSMAQPASTGAQPEPQVEPTGRSSPIEMPPATAGPTSLRTAAQQGDPGAQFEVAARFAEGKGMKQDFHQAIVWYTRAAQKGFIPAQYRLASLYERGLGTPADITRAKVWYRRAADQGNVKSMHNLAVLAAGPQQAEPDYLTAARWFTEAAERGLADSQFNLGVLTENGLGMTKDALQAYKWFALAARSGDKEASRRRDHLAATFTPDEARAGELLVSNWRARPVDMKANDPRAAGVAWAAEKEAAALATAQKQTEQRQAAAPQTAPMAPPPPAGAPPKAKPAKVTRQ